MTKSNLKRLIFTVILTIVATFAYTNISEAACFPHSYTKATCTQPKKCTVCGETFERELGHNWSKKSSTAATCTSVGKTVTECLRCGITQTSNTAALGHSLTTKTTAATCTSAGEEVTSCLRAGCSYKKATILPALSHNISTKTTAATCTAPGKIVTSCSLCDYERIEQISKLGHNTTTKTTAATCTAPGKIVTSCLRCDYESVSLISASGHNYTVSTTNASCTVAGKTVKTCRNCGDTKTTTGEALGHNYVEKVTEATCVSTGKIVNTCSRCGDKTETPIPALGHDKKIVYNENYHWYECERCNLEIDEREVHNFNDDNICIICGYYVEGDSEPDEPNNPDESKDEFDEDELIIEPWMKENDELNCLAVSLRSEPYEGDRANKNIYALNEKVIYYVDYKNGGKDTEKTVTLELTLPLAFSVVDSDGAKVSKTKKTFTWTFDGMENEESGTKVVVVKYTSLGSSSATYKRITPEATINLGNTEKDISAVLNLVVKDFDIEIKDEHEPYMYGDRDTQNFRPDDTITRAEGALVLTRIFGISTMYDSNTYSYPDLNETYLEARRAVMAATAYGIIEGYPDGTYRPNQPMTRAEFITILAKQIEEEYGEGFEVKDEESLIKVYKDRNRLYYISNTEYYNNHWSVAYATLLARLNMTSLTEDSTNLRIDDYITRAEVAQLVNFYLLRAPADVSSSTRVPFPDVSKKHKLFADIVEATREAHRYSITEEGTEEEE